MLTNEFDTCRIGQKCRCSSTGCEWKKVFNHFCWLRTNNKVVSSYVPAEDVKPFFAKKKKKKKGKVIKEELKYTEINPLRNNPIPVVSQTGKKDIDFSNKITTASQDDWLKKIKTI